MSNSPIFITGVYRSGTTLLTGLIGAHKDIDIGHPTVQYYRYILKKDIDPNTYLDIVKSIADRVDFRYGIKLDVKKIIQEIEAQVIKSGAISHQIIYDCVSRGLHGFSGKRWSEKILLEWTNIPTFINMYPKGKTVHIIRDPRDVLASYKNMTYETEEKYLDAVFNCLSSMQHARRYLEELNTDTYYLIKFEDLVANKLEELKKLCKFLNLNFDPNHYEQYNIKEGAGDGSVDLTIKTHSAFPDSANNNSFKRWDTKLSMEELDFAESILEGEMKYFGYELSNGFEHNNLKWLIKIFKNNPLIKERFNTYLETGKGAESFPSDATDPKNWSSSTLDQGKELGKGAANAYKKLFK